MVHGDEAYMEVITINGANTPLPTTAALLSAIQVFVGPFSVETTILHSRYDGRSLTFLLSKMEIPNPDLSYLVICI
jgi:hypothetical protein